MQAACHAELPPWCTTVTGHPSSGACCQKVGFSLVSVEQPLQLRCAFQALPAGESASLVVNGVHLSYMPLTEGLVWIALCLFIPLPPLLSNSLTHPYGPSVMPFRIPYKDRNILKHYALVSDYMQQSCNHSHDYCKMPFDRHVRVAKRLSRASCPLHVT